jgi:hypothetical protein
MNIVKTEAVRKKMGCKSRNTEFSDLSVEDRFAYLQTRGTDESKAAIKCPTCGIPVDDPESLYCSVVCWIIRTEIIEQGLMNGSRSQHNRYTGRVGKEPKRLEGLYIKGHNLGKPKSYRWGKDG